ncbi:MAG: hypothetical protein D6679_10475 [Candidatus Hydrogenedentota bacterium]|nr:MAG: hypothetical protein D6679_10475 [Candidatus Hydrogenedentota bacterium]
MPFRLIVSVLRASRFGFNSTFGGQAFRCAYAHVACSPPREAPGTSIRRFATERTSGTRPKESWKYGKPFHKAPSPLILQDF